MVQKNSLPLLFCVFSYALKAQQVEVQVGEKCYYYSAEYSYESRDWGVYRGYPKNYGPFTLDECIKKMKETKVGKIREDGYPKLWSETKIVKECNCNEGEKNKNHNPSSDSHPEEEKNEIEKKSSETKTKLPERKSETKKTSTTVNNDLGELRVFWAGVVDNAEGDNCPHGPTGSLHIRVFPTKYPCPGDQIFYDEIFGNDMGLEGPTTGNFCPLWLGFPKANKEWVDGDAIRMNKSIYEWKEEDEEVMVFIYESDPDKVAGRKHDAVFCVNVSRMATVNRYKTLYDTKYPAHDDAIKNCKKANMTWIKRVWPAGIVKGIPGIFLQVKTPLSN